MCSYIFGTLELKWQTCIPKINLGLEKSFEKKKSLNGFGSDPRFSFNHYSTDILSLFEPIHMHVTCLKPEAICTCDPL